MAKMKRKELLPINLKDKDINLYGLLLIIIMIPVVIVGYVLLTSIGGQNRPVEGSRFSKKS